MNDSHSHAHAARDRRGAITLLALLVPIALAAGCHAGGTRPESPGPVAERVNNGYAEMDRRDVTGAVSSLSERDLRNVRETRIEDLLRGRIPGLEVQRGPRGSFSLQIRGPGSLMGGNEPLIVIDGMPASPGVLSMIAPSTVRRIDVLKDAGTTAAYGVRGANGVIVITTWGAERPHR